MRKNDAITELVAGYNTYVGAEDLNVSAAGDAPASGRACITFPTTMTTTISTVTAQ
ncbi:LxmA leader domain family RiPP [Streptosporangium sp. NPDC000396]|uniref:LxmA leader domain family RiPP n=1 Tax=Streptosporangium sp. NPDC000396 TaxID=3366185 RepID=UPI00368A5B75